MTYLLIVVLLTNGSAEIKTKPYRSESHCAAAAKAVTAPKGSTVKRIACIAIN